MSVPQNTITTAQMTNAQIREIEFTELFKENLSKLVEALGITRKIAKQAGSTLSVYKATGTLQSGAVAEGEVIPLSQYQMTKIPYGEITLKKWRKSTTAEAIIEAGYDAAVQMTTDRMLKDVQNGVRTDFFSFLASTSGKSTITGKVGLQATLAACWGKLQNVYEDNAIESVYFINPDDIADYLATAQITTQTAFGMSYVENFLGLGTVFMNSSVTKGKVYATAKENLVLYYIPVNGADLGEAFSFTSDELGLIGIHEKPNYDDMTCQDIVVSGVGLFAEVLTGCVVATIGSQA